MTAGSGHLRRTPAMEGFPARWVIYPAAVFCVGAIFSGFTSASPTNVETMHLTSLHCENATDCSCAADETFHYAICYQGNCACSLKPEPHTSCSDHTECSCLQGVPICHDDFCFCLPDFIALEERLGFIGL